MLRQRAPRVQWGAKSIKRSAVHYIQLVASEFAKSGPQIDPDACSLVLITLIVEAVAPTWRLMLNQWAPLV